MRLGVLDVGSNTVHLLVVDAHPGARPFPESSYKVELRLAEHLDDQGCLSADGITALTGFIGQCLEVAEDRGAEEVMAFATSAVREAPNGAQVLAQVREATGVDLTVLSGQAEAELTFLAVRRWFGWSAGRLLVLDIGGGSLEMAVGLDELPDKAVSLPLGAGRVTRDLLGGDPPTAQDVREARKRIRAEVARAIPDLVRVGAADHVVGTSKTFRSLARICGAAPSSEGPYVPRLLRRDDLRERLSDLAEMTYAQRAELPGISPSRAPQLLAGALVADAVMDLLSVTSLELCPWALREGVILRRIDSVGLTEPA